MARALTFSKLIRRTHLFLALFLTPWVLMYAVSTLAMHHRTLFTGEAHRVDPGYETVLDTSFVHTANEDRHDFARRILSDLGMEGAFSVRGDFDDERLTIVRDRPVGSYRLRYETDTGALRVEQQRFGMVYALEMLHRRRGFQHPFLANDLWAVVVDGVIVAILLWAATGLWMWWEMARTRRLGALCLAGGLLLFLLFLLTL